TGFFPIEDQGYLFVSVQLPDAASQQRTRDVMRRIDEILAESPGVEDWITIGGLSLIDNSSAPNAGTLFVTLKSWENRKTEDESMMGVLMHLQEEFAKIQEGIVLVFPPPAIRGVGVRGGFQMQVEDRSDVGLAVLQQATEAIVDDAQAQSALSGVNTNFRPGVPQLFVDVDREKVKALDVSLEAVFNTLQAYLGSTYVNDFNKFGRTFQVRVQAESAYRAQPEDIKKLEVRNARGEMIPLGTMINVERTFGPQTIVRYNLYPSAAISGDAAPG